MGTVFIFGGPTAASPDQLRFSPLLDGDGVASVGGTASQDVAPLLRFSPPSRWGLRCIQTNPVELHTSDFRFSPLLDGDGVASAAGGLPYENVRISVSVPFSMGKHLLMMLIPRHAVIAGFSPLLDGDGIAPS